MMDRFNVWVGSLFARSQDISFKNDRARLRRVPLVLSVIVVGVLVAVLMTGLGSALGNAIGKVTSAINGS